MKIKHVPIDKLSPDPANVRRHPDRNLAAIKASLQRFGQQKPIVADAKGIVRAGNGTLEAARSLGWKTVAVVETPLAGSEATAYAIADNRTAELAEWDDPALAETLQALQAEDFDLGAIGFDEAELAGLLGTPAQEPAPDPGPQIDRAAELQTQWKTAVGQLWEIPSKATPGQCHRLLCGDSTKAEDVARLCPEKVQGAFTSPPYAEQRKEQYGGTSADLYVGWWEAIQANVRSVLKEDGSFFVNIKPHCEDGERSLYVMDLVLAMKRQWGWRYVEEFIWKNSGVPKEPARRFKNQFEPVHHFAISADSKFRPQSVMHESDRSFSKAGKGKASNYQGNEDWSKDIEVSEGMAYPGNVLSVNYDSHDGQGIGHSAAFPVGLPDFFLRAFSDHGDLWLDPFSGSGTTIVAAEQTGRLCHGIELAPKYVAVALQRLADMGLEPLVFPQEQERNRKRKA